MKLSQRSYPHPVVGNNDDVQNAAFQAALTITSDSKNYYIAIAINSNSETLRHYLTDGKVTYTAHVECSNTLYRKAFSFTEETRTITISKEEINDLVEVTIFVCATQKISGYKIAGAHPDYGSSTFEISAGDILAMSETQTFPAENDFDSMKRVGSIMVVVESRTESDEPMSLETNADKISILLSKTDFKEYKTLMNGAENLIGPLTCAIVLPALMEAVNLLRLEEDPSNYTYKWMRILNDRIDKGGLQNEDPLIVAQRLLELPIKRALAETRMLADNGS